MKETTVPVNKTGQTVRSQRCSVSEHTEKMTGFSRARIHAVYVNKLAGQTAHNLQTMGYIHRLK